MAKKRKMRSELARSLIKRKGSFLQVIAFGPQFGEASHETDSTSSDEKTEINTNPNLQESPA